MIFAWADFVAVHKPKANRFYRCRMQHKSGRIRPTNSQKTILAVIITLTASLALAEDFKTVNGKEYKNATIKHVEIDGIVLSTKSGITKVYFTELPKEVQERFHYNPAVVAAAQRRAQREAEQIASQAMQDERGLTAPTEEEEDEALPKKMIICVIVFVVCLIIALGVYLKKSYF